MQMCNCIVCHTQLAPTFSLGPQPLANKYPKSLSDTNNEFKAEMNVYFCEECGYASVPCSVDRGVFFEDYYYLSSVNKELNNHFIDLAEEIYQKKFTFVVDVGSNDGILLRPLKERGVKFLGVDPSENVSKIANDNGLTTTVGFFDESMVKNIHKEYGRPDLITASSVFTHLDDPLSFFENVKNLLQPKGRLIIEVEYLQKIVSDFAFERFYFDRPHYYSLKSLAKMGAKYGFNIEDAVIINVHGGSLRVTFVLGGAVLSNSNVEKLLEQESIYLKTSNLLSKFNDFRIGCENMRKAISEFKSNGFTVAGYGCPARFSTITNFSGLSASDISYVVDDSPLKQGRFSPGMHIPIVSYNPDEKPDVYIVFAFEYIASIKEKVGVLIVGYFKPVPFIEI
jgi:methylation protein EvaC